MGRYFSWSVHPSFDHFLQNMVVCSTTFQYLDIHKATWISPNRIILITLSKYRLSLALFSRRELVYCESWASSSFDLKWHKRYAPLNSQTSSIDIYLTSATLRTTAKTLLGFECPPQRNQWYNEKFTNFEMWKRKRRRKEEERLFRRKKRKQEDGSLRKSICANIGKMVKNFIKTCGDWTLFWWLQTWYIHY